MRFNEFLIENPKQKSMVIRTLQKKDDADPIFSNIYKKIVGTPLAGRIKKYIKTRNDQDAITAADWLVKTIPTLGTSAEVKEFLNNFVKADFDYINTSALIPPGGMSSPASIMDVVKKDTLAEKLFNELFHNYMGKGDAGPGEAALAVLSPNITYGSPGDIVVNGKKIEVKASRNKQGKAGRIWDMPVHQAPMIDILERVGLTSFRIAHGENPFPDPELSNNFIEAACLAWFGVEDKNIINAFGKSGFFDIWIAKVFDTYKLHGKWEGMLAIGLTAYQYVETGEQFAKYTSFADKGYIALKGAKQSRMLAPQIKIN